MLAFVSSATVSVGTHESTVPGVEISPDIASLSGPGGSTFRSFDVASGDLLSERRLHSPRNGQLFEPTDIGVHLAFVDGGSTSTKISSSDVLALTNGRTVRRIDVASGKVKWEWSSEDKSLVLQFYAYFFSFDHLHLGPRLFILG